MKTVFKVGMKVYDRFVFPNKEGKVIEVVDDDDYPIKVYYEGLEINELSYTSDGRYHRDFSPSLSTKPYFFEGFEQKVPVPTCEDAWEWIGKNPKDRHLYEEDLYFKIEALKNLIVLRDYYNEGWQPNWEDDEWKYFIEYYRGELEVNRTCGNSRVLHFKSRDMAKRFLKEQKELLEIAKPLL